MINIIPAEKQSNEIFLQNNCLYELIATDYVIPITIWLVDNSDPQACDLNKFLNSQEFSAYQETVIYIKPTSSLIFQCLEQRTLDHILYFSGVSPDLGPFMSFLSITPPLTICVNKLAEIDPPRLRKRKRSS
jgi:hypothetical protein